MHCIKKKCPLDPLSVFIVSVTCVLAYLFPRFPLLVQSFRFAPEVHGSSSGGQGPSLIGVPAITLPRLEDVPVRLVTIGEVEALTLILDGEVVVPFVRQVPLLRGQVVVALPPRET